MIIVGILEWWYTRGLVDEVRRIQNMLASTYDYFSIDLLLKTLFTPFRQISAGSVHGPIAVQIRAFADRLFSRVIGAFIRTFMIVFGSLALVVAAIIGLLRFGGWLVVPFVPIVGLILALAGWIPWKL